MGVPERLIRVLADGAVHSGSDLAQLLGVSRSAVWKQVHRLGDLGLRVEAESGKGYRLDRGLDLLDGRAIYEGLDPTVRARCESLQVKPVMSSTSTSLAAEPAPAVGAWRATLAEYQTGGRGRRGRRWFSPFASGLCLSVGYSFAGGPRDLPALSLAAGLGVVRPLLRLGARGLALKWPNDVLVNGAKLAGILVDVDGDARGPLRAILGVGVNLSTPADLAAAVRGTGGLPPGTLEQAGLPAQPGRNELAAMLIASIVDVLDDFGHEGFEPLAEEWAAHDYLRGRQLVIESGPETLAGTGRGIGPDGALRVEAADGRVRPVFNGEVTVRCP